MSARWRISRPRRARAWASTPLGCLLVVGALGLAGCGSSKPAYCSARSNLESSIKGLTSLNVSSGVSGLKSQLQKIESSATQAVDKAKSDFPTETKAITSSLDSLESAVKGLSSSPSTSQIASVAGDATKLVSSVKTFTDATASKCK